MIHIFKIKNLNFLIDVYSGSIHLISNIIYSMLSYIKNENFFKINKTCSKEIFNKLNILYKEHEINEAYNEIIQLYNENLLFSKEDNFFNNEINNYYDYNITKALCLNITDFCNLQCQYCFAGMNKNLNKCHIMSKSTAFKSIDFLVKKSKNIKNLEIDFFGGEPLIGFDLIKEIIEYSKNFKNKNFRFTLTTNGILLNNEMIDYINLNIHNVILSLDGRKIVNDKFRIHSDNKIKSTYDIIVPKFQKLVLERNKLNKEYFIRGTFTNKNLDFSNDFQHLLNLNFNNISLEPILSTDDNINIKMTNLSKIFYEYEIISQIIIENYKNNNKVNFYHYIFNIYNSPCIFKKIKGCGAGYEYLCIDTNGDIFPCHQLVKNKDFKLGNIKNNTFENNKNVRKFYDLRVINNFNCKNCWAKYYCSGGCGAVNYNINNNFDKNYEIHCELFKKRLELSIYTNYILNIF